MTAWLEQDAEVVELAARRARRTRAALLALLAPHKVALLAVERSAAAEAVRKVTEATTVDEMVRGASVQVRAAAVVAWKIASQHVQKELAALGIALPEAPKQSLDYAKQLVWDLIPALANPNLTLAEKARRAGLAASVSANRAYSEAQLAWWQAAVEAGSVQLRKVWAANFAAPTPPCVFCVALNGVSVELDESFPLPAGAPAPYGGVLDAPPMHPHCRCRLVTELAPVRRAVAE